MMANSPSAHDEDVQRRLERQSLRNVRSLLDKIEDEAARERTTRRAIGYGLLAAFGLGLAASVLWSQYRHAGVSSREIVMPAATRTAPQSAPPGDAPAPTSPKPAK
jgi:hypothetical protein